MELWVKYALLAGIFIAVKDFLMKNITNKYTYIDYLIYAITISFILIWSYVLFTQHKPKPIDKQGLGVILIRILVIYLIIDPSIFKALKNTNRVGEVSALLNVSIIVAFILGIFLLNTKIDKQSLLGVALIIGGVGCMNLNK